MKLLERFRQAGGYWEGMASGAAVLMTFGADDKREIAAPNLIAAAQEAYSTNGVVFAVVLARLMLLSEAKFTLRNKVTQKLYGTEDLRILEYPWVNGTGGELLARMEQDVSLSGNAFIAKVDDQTLLRIPPQEMTIISAETTGPTGIKYKQLIGYDWDPKLNTQNLRGGNDTNAQHFTPEEIVHWSPYPDPMANWRGMSWLTPIIREVYADSGMTNYKTLYLDRGQPVQAIKYAAKLRPDTIDSVAERLMAKYGGVSNAWRPLIVDQGADPIMSAPLKDLDYRAIQEGGEGRICAAAGVPPIVVGLKNAESGETYQTAMRRFADLYARFSWRTACVSLEKFVPNLPPKGVELWYDTTGIAALQAAETERAQVTHVNSAALLTFIQAGMTRASAIAAVTSGDLSQLVPDPLAPTPGVTERETITGTDPFSESGSPDTASGSRPPVTGVPPGGPQSNLTKPQNPQSTKPGPSSFPGMPGGVPASSTNGGK